MSNLLQMGKVVNLDRINQFPVVKRTHTTAADQQAFDALYEALQQIGDIAEKTVKNGEKSYKPALRKIRQICQSIE